MRVELDNSHKYYMEALKMSLKIPAAALVAQFTLIGMYGFLLRSGVEAKNASRGLTDLMEILLYTLPLIGAFLSVALAVLQFSAREATILSTKRYLQPNRMLLSLPIPRAEGGQEWKGRIELGIYLLCLFGYGCSFVVWNLLLLHAILK